MTKIVATMEGCCSCNDEFAAEDVKGKKKRVASSSHTRRRVSGRLLFAWIVLLFSFGVIKFFADTNLSLTFSGGAGDTFTSPLRRSESTSPTTSTRSTSSDGVATPSRRFPFYKNETKGSTKPLAIFYNVYLPPADVNDGNNDKTDEAEDEGDETGERQRKLADDESPSEEPASMITPPEIVREQLGQIADSYATGNSKYDVTIYYNTIGSGSESKHVGEFCDELKLRCIYMHHYDDDGRTFEEVTLSRLHDYCTDIPFKDYKVTYVHSKGSFHVRENQNWWRRYMTGAVTHEDCIEASETKGCNFCGLYFAPVPWPHMSGNMFTATCDYVNKLLPPVEFGNRTVDMVAGVRHKLHETKQFTMNIYNDYDDYHGFGRFVNDHWPGSHPDVIPCDMGSRPMSKESFPIEEWKKDHGTTNDKELFQFNKYPDAYDVTTNTMIRNRMRRLPKVKRANLNNWKIRIREYWLLAGNVYKWLYLYGTTPPDDSWVWDVYPDSYIWKKAIKEHGANDIKVVDKVLDTYK